LRKISSFLKFWILYQTRFFNDKGGFVAFILGIVAGLKRSTEIKIGRLFWGFGYFNLLQTSESNASFNVRGLDSTIA
jgi:hypothetical protein